MLRKYTVIAFGIIVVICVGFLVLQQLLENREYVKVRLNENPIGSFLLDIYQSVRRAGSAPGPAYFEANKISYSIFADDGPPKENAAERQALPEFKVIPGLDANFKARTFPSIKFDRWQRGHGDNYSSKYSQLDQINRSNIRDLAVAWIYHSGETEWAQSVETNPVIAGGKVFITTTAGRLVAIDATTGVEKWRNTYIETAARRGLLWWPGNAATGPRLFVPSIVGTYAVDPETGNIIAGFGNAGRVGTVSLVAPVVDGNRLIVAEATSALEAFDVESGKPLWKTSLLKFGPAIAQYSSQLPPGHFQLSGGVPWAGISLDQNRHRVFVTTGNARPSMYGVSRPGPNDYTSSVLSINSETGVVDWSFQETAHDLWDFDVPSPPILTTIKRAGQPIDVVAAVTKRSNTLLLERDTGKPVFDFRLRRAPSSTVPGEKTAPYQPDLETPQTFGKNEFEPSDITDLSTTQTQSIARQLGNATFGFFAPPILNGKVADFGQHGGGEWPGAAVDPESGILYVPSNQYPWLLRLHYSETGPNPVRKSDKVGDDLYQSKCASCHGANREGYYEQELTGGHVNPSLVGLSATRDVGSEVLFRVAHAGLPKLGPVTADDIKTIGNYLRTADHSSDERKALNVTFAWNILVDDDGYPGTRPPWGLLTAIDLNSGQKVWQVPFGEYSELTKRGIPVTGQLNFGGVMVSKGGLVFATGTIDQKLRAYDAATGQQLWDYDLPAAGSAPPSTYEIGGIQYVVVVASGGWYAGFKDRSDAVIAFRLKQALKKGAQ